MRAVLDACVLYPTVLRQIILGVAEAGLITPLWSDRLLEEWVRTAARRGGPADKLVAEGEIAHLSARFPAARIAPDRGLEARLWLPDRHDVHVLATAIAGRAETILTLNLRDFPRRELAPHGITAVHPDAALYEAWLAHPEIVAGQVADVHATAERLSDTAIRLNALLKRARLPRLAKALRAG